MKKFIITNLLTALTLPLLACGWVDTHNYYMFSVYDATPFSERMLTISNRNWAVYLGQDPTTYYYFNSSEAAEIAKKKGDVLMASYIKQLDDYLKVAQEMKWDKWDYPSKEKLAQRKATIEKIRTYANSKLGTRLRSQHALLLMRCNMLLGNHQANVTFWENSAVKYIETVYKDLMKNIYAGALVKTGRQDEGCRIFAEQGDGESLMTLYYEKRSYKAIREEYERNPQSKVLPFLVQDFVNNAQEAVDNNSRFAGGLPGKLFIRDITEREANSMCLFAESVVRAGKTDQPALWKSAEAWLRYLYGAKKQALRSIDEAQRLEGTQAVKDCARALQVYITAEEANDNALTEGVKWLSEQRKATGNTYFDRVYDRMVHQVLFDKYEQQGRTETALALLYGNDRGAFNAYVDTMQVVRLINYYNYQKAPARTAIDRYAREIWDGPKEDVAFAELIGMKYMRLCQWSKAIEWLEQVPGSRYNEGALAYYAAHRVWTIEPWIKRQWLKESLVYGSNEPQHMVENPKISFAREMMRMEQQYTKLRGEGREQCAYDLATRYAQAHFTGDCWYLMRDTKSVYDTLRVNEADLAERVVSLLKEVAQSKNKKIREKALFGLCYSYLQTGQKWRVSEWENGEYVWKNNRTSTHWQRWAALADFAASNEVSPFVSRCDEYRQFLKAYNRH